MRALSAGFSHRSGSRYSRAHRGRRTCCGRSAPAAGRIRDGSAGPDSTRGVGPIVMPLASPERMQASAVSSVKLHATMTGPWNILSSSSAATGACSSILGKSFNLCARLLRAACNPDLPVHTFHRFVAGIQNLQDEYAYLSMYKRTAYVRRPFARSGLCSARTAGHSNRH